MRRGHSAHDAHRGLLGEAEHLGDVEDVACPEGAHADLGVARVQDLIAVDLGVHEALVEVVDVGAGAHVVTELLPPLDLRLDVLVVVGTAGRGHVCGVVLAPGDEVRRHGEGAQPAADALLVDVGGQRALDVRRRRLCSVRPANKPRKNATSYPDTPHCPSNTTPQLVYS